MCHFKTNGLQFSWELNRWESVEAVVIDAIVELRIYSTTTIFERYITTILLVFRIN